MHLAQQMVAEAGSGGQILLEGKIRVGKTAVMSLAARAAILRPDIIEIGVERRIMRELIRFGGIRLRHFCLGRRGFGDRRIAAIAVGAFQQRIALQLLMHEILQFKRRHLQQLDRLLQLRRHDQRLRLTQV